MTTSTLSSNKIGPDGAPVLVIAVSLLSIVSSFLIANSDLDLATKTGTFTGIVIAYLVFSIAAYYFKLRRARRFATANDSDDDIENHLRLIEDAGRFFSGTLNPADTFRLIAAKLGEVVKFDACVLYRIDRNSAGLRPIQSQGDHAEAFMKVGYPPGRGVVWRSIESGEVEVETGLLTATEPLPIEALSGFRSVAAIPFNHCDESIAVLVVFSTDRKAFDQDAVHLLEAAGERALPLVTGSMSYEKNLNNAMTDPVTDLPNERALYLILENQIAESQRKAGDRPLSVLAMDILAFDELNSRYGHATGDKILAYVATTIKRQLRQMDLVARTVNDEFLAVLPTANEEMAQEIVRRISATLAASTLFLDTAVALRPELTFGIATFGTHGDTAERLLKSARLLKNQSKANVPRKVLWFPREFIN